MKLLTFALGLLILLGASFDTAQAATTRVKGYTRSNGTYVAPHYKSTPNRSKLDNYSTKGNSNPYTGKKGTKKI